jgi:hypothetical protein
MDLVQEISSKLGVDANQAKGGAGLLLKLAQEHLGPDFDKVCSQFPMINDLIKAAPTQTAGGAGGGLMGAIGGMLGGMGGKVGAFGDLAKLTDQFSALGLTPDMIVKYGQTIIGFVRDHGHPELADLLAGALTKYSQPA